MPGEIVRIALLCDSYPPSRNSAAVQIRDLAAEFARKGHSVHVIVPDGSISGRCTEDAGAVHVVRVPSSRTSDVGRVRRAIAESLMPFAMISALRRSSLAEVQWDAVVWYSPSIFLWPVVLWLQGRRRSCKYLILRDMFPEWAKDLGLLGYGPAYAYFWIVSRAQYWTADVIGVQSQSNLSYLKGWEGRGRRLEVLHNWLEDAQDSGCSISISKTALAGRTVLVYIGNMGVAQGMDVLLDLAGALRHRDDVGMLFVGRGSEVARLKSETIARGLVSVLFFDEIDTCEIPGLLAQCHVGLIALDPLHRSHNIPGKFLTYLQAGLPVLARINAGTDLVELIEHEGVGRSYSGSSTDEMRDLALQLIDDEDMRRHMGSRGQELAKRMFAPEGAVARITDAVASSREVGIR